MTIANMTVAQWMTALEWLAAGLGVVNIALLIFRNVWNFAFGIASVAIYIFVFWENRLYAESGLQVFFIAAQAWGWWMWRRIGGDDDRVPVRWLDWKARAVWLMGTASISLNLGWAMARYTNAAAPYVDGPIAVASMAAQILLAFRRIENWLLWIAIDVAAVSLYIHRGLYPTAGLYGGMLVMSLIGLKEWVEADRRETIAAAQ
ncbi:nicotinamide riboside transporter PnuC [Novosphingobium aquimarinum]|uniref:nicotinamide riboside transporter PnuC n=1 Tax=Novosphingobium aquimarinum TaxID=2682494 RepID=UPI001E4ACE11|nr:nicotinamide riboside transporter PnuC [Novosphingobium aquimarinum]